MLLVRCICLELRGVKKAASDQGPWGMWSGYPGWPWKERGIFLEIRARNVCGWCVKRCVQSMCGAWGV